MNCMEFRKTLLADPRASATEIRSHRRECPQCAAFAARAERMEEEIRAAVLVDPPEALASSILLRRSLAEPPAVVPASRRRVLALAAAMGLAATGLVGANQWRRQRALEEELVAHLRMKHPAGFGAQQQGIEGGEISALLARAGFALRADLGPVVNAWPCVFRDRPIAHLLLPGAAGPVTVLLLPFAPLSWRHSFAGKGLAGAIASCAGGAIAVMARHHADVDRVEARLQHLIGSV